jgi:zeta-carotene isomerase
MRATCAGEQLMGARAWRVLFAGISLPLAAVALFYFINHRYDGTPLWDIRSVPGVHTAVWITNFVSFLLLYPSTFNLLEVAAVYKPKLHLWETGVTRITRHPQAWGQLLWCVAHTAWIGNSFMVWTSLGLTAHHALGCFHGDFRLRREFGEQFDAVKGRTSIVPFAAILDGRQQLPNDYWREWARVPYAAVVVFTLGTYFAHPLMQQAAYLLNW